MNDPIINALKAEQLRLAQESLRRPPKSGTSDMSYEYGYSVGLFAGLERAIERILQLYQDESKGDFFE